MKIENLRLEKSGDLAKVAATLIWEDDDILLSEISVEATEDSRQDLSCNSNALLFACTMPPTNNGEKRVDISVWIDIDSTD